MIKRTGLNLVRYTISGTKGYARVTNDELAVLRTMEKANPEYVITSVEADRRMSVR